AADDKPLVLFPNGQLPELDNAPRRKIMIADAPSPKLSRVEHRNARYSLRRNILWPHSGQNTQPQFRTAVAKSFVTDHASANNPLPKSRLDRHVNRSGRRGSYQRNRLR